LNRSVALYLATLIVIVPIDFLFLGVVAKGFFASQVGDMLGEIRPAPAILFSSSWPGLSRPCLPVWKDVDARHKAHKAGHDELICGPL